MGHKIVCLECKIAFNEPLDKGSEIDHICPECRKSITVLPHRFRPPKKADGKKWQTIRFLIENGFYFQPVYESIEIKNGITYFTNRVIYPENLRDAREFVAKFKSQATK